MKIYSCFKNIDIKNISQEFRLKNMDKTRNYFLEEIYQNKLMTKTLISIEHFRILVSAYTGCILISAFSSLIGVSAGITSSAIGLKICAITAGIKTYNSII